TGETSFRQVAAETLDFVAREMTHPEGGFYSSLDADSEGREGKYYVWTQAEIREVIGDPSMTELFLAAYDAGTAPASQGEIVLQRAPNDANLSARFDKSASEIEELLQRARARLFRARQARPRPGLDDKVILAWNGLMLQAFAQAARCFGGAGSGTGDMYLEVATRNAAFLLGNLRSHGQLHRIWRRGKTGQHVFLEDYAALILGLLDLYQADFSNAWFIAARQLADEMLLRFAAPDGGFFDTPDDSKPPLIRPMELQDGATPAGGALATEALLKLAALTGEATYRVHAERALPLGLANAAESPLSCARWLAAAAFALAGPRQLALLFPPSANPAAFLGVLNSAFRPHWMVAASPYPPPTGAPPLLQDRPVVANLPTAFVCRDFACLRPITDPAELPALL
ncbi:MAG TPA: hypothetical protein VLL49_07885, partial [Anaerolineales bacterium]|nr:hypothetical protein [Anaerolineales bacterium]